MTEGCLAERHNSVPGAVWDAVEIDTVDFGWDRNLPRGSVGPDHVNELHGVGRRGELRAEAPPGRNWAATSVHHCGSSFPETLRPAVGKQQPLTSPVRPRRCASASFGLCGALMGPASSQTSATTCKGVARGGWGQVASRKPGLSVCAGVLVYEGGRDVPSGGRGRAGRRRHWWRKEGHERGVITIDRQSYGVAVLTSRHRKWCLESLRGERKWTNECVPTLQPHTPSAPRSTQCGTGGACCACCGGTRSSGKEEQSFGPRPARNAETALRVAAPHSGAGRESGARRHTNFDGSHITLGGQNVEALIKLNRSLRKRCKRCCQPASSHQSGPVL